MAFSSNDDTPMREYLLGGLAGKDRDDFEERFFTEEELLDRLHAAEEDLIDDYLSGNLNHDDVERFQRHFLIGAKRKRALRIGKAWKNYAAEHAQEKPQKPQKPTPVSNWLQKIVSAPALKAATAAAVVVIAAAGVWLSLPSDVDKGLQALNAAFKPGRPLESRLTVLDYAPYNSTGTRGPGSPVDENELIQADVKLRGAVAAKPTAKANHAVGNFYLAKKEFDKAIEHFEQALKKDPDAAQIYADLGAALFEKGKLEFDKAKSDKDRATSDKAMEYYGRSLDNLNIALERDKNLLEALYNRALLRESMGTLAQAEEDWHKYLELDPNSKWSAEARERLAKVEQERKKTSETHEEIFNRFVNQFNSNDEDGVWITVSRYHNRSGNIVVERLIDDYLEAATRNDKTRANQAKQHLTYLGNLQIRRAGDRFFYDQARYYEAADSKQRELVINARGLMKRAHAGWGQDDPVESLRLFESARNLFEQASDYPEVRVAEYWMSFSYYNAPEKQKESRAILDRVFVASKKQQYHWLHARALYLRSSLEAKAGEHSKAVETALQSAELAKSKNDSVGQLNATSSLVDYYRYLGSYAESLAFIQQALPLTASSLDPVQGTRHYNLAASAFSRMGLHGAALGFEREALRFASNTSNDRLKSQNYAYLGAIQGTVKNFDEALKNVQLAFDLAAHSPNKGRGMMAYALLQMGHIYRNSGDCDKAVDHYTQAIPDYKTNIPLQYEARKGAFLCYIQQQNDELAQTEMSILFDLLKQHRQKLSYEDHRNTFFDVEQPVVDAAIDFEYSRRNNPDAAFNYLNLARARSLLDLLEADKQVMARVLDQRIKLDAASEPRSLQEIKNQLPEQTQLVQYVMLENKLLIWVISRNDARVEMLPISKKDVNEKLRRFLDIISRLPKDNESQELLLAKELYEILIQPVAKFLDQGKILCIVPDGTLSYLPFAALVSPASGKYLFEERQLMTAPSPSVFLRCSENAAQKIAQTEQKVLSVGNPTFNGADFPDFGNLPHAGKEAVAVGRLYHSPALTETVATKEAVKRNIKTADVIHLALHSTVNDVVPLRSKLLLADSVFHAWEIYNLDLSRARLVVLSSCESGAGHYYRGEGMSSFARAFMSAGAPLVIASLWRVESSATETLMVNFHRLRKNDMSTVDALKTAQHQMAYGPAEKLRRPYYWAAFTVTGGYAEF